MVDWSPSTVLCQISLDFFSDQREVEEIWIWNSGKMLSKLVFIGHEVSVTVIELDVIEVTIDGLHTIITSELED